MFPMPNDDDDNYNGDNDKNNNRPHHNTNMAALSTLPSSWTCSPPPSTSWRSGPGFAVDLASGSNTSDLAAGSAAGSTGSGGFRQTSGGVEHNGGFFQNDVGLQPIGGCFQQSGSSFQQSGGGGYQHSGGGGHQRSSIGGGGGGYPHIHGGGHGGYRRQEHFNAPPTGQNIHGEMASAEQQQLGGGTWCDINQRQAQQVPEGQHPCEGWSDVPLGDGGGKEDGAHENFEFDGITFGDIYPLGEL